MKRSGICVSCFAFYIIILLLASIHFPLSQSQSSDLIDQICKKTPFYDLCISTLHSSPLSPKTDLKGLALLMVNQIVANASDTLSYIEGMIKNTKDPNLEQALAFCAELYIPVVKYILPQAADAISHNRFVFASYSVSEAMNELFSCDKKFLSGSAQSPLGDRTSIVQKLVEVGEAIIKLLISHY